MMFPGPDSACLYLDPSAGLTDGGLWKDSSKNGLHITPVGYAAPNWGYSLGPSGAPRITFNGVNQCGTMGAVIAARFFTVAPSTSLTVAVVARHNAPAASDRIFTCANGVSTRGFAFCMQTAERTRISASDAAGASCLDTVENADAPYTSRTRVTVFSATSLLAASLCWIDGVGRTTSTAVNGNPIGYDAAQIPVVGAHVGGAALFFDGDLYFLGIWPLIFNHQESVAFSNFWMDRT